MTTYSKSQEEMFTEEAMKLATPLDREIEKYLREIARLGITAECEYKVVFDKDSLVKYIMMKDIKGPLM